MLTGYVQAEYAKGSVGGASMGSSSIAELLVSESALVRLIGAVELLDAVGAGSFVVALDDASDLVSGDGSLVVLASPR